MTYRIPLTAGQRFRWAKTIAESDVYLFAGITGDLSPNHVDEQYMSRTVYGTRIAHGALLLSYASAVSTQIQTATGGNCVSYGYDRVRFLAGVPIGETITVQFEIDDVDQAAQKVISRVEIRTADGTLAATAPASAWVSTLSDRAEWVMTGPPRRRRPGTPTGSRGWPRRRARA